MHIATRWTSWIFILASVTGLAILPGHADTLANTNPAPVSIDRVVRVLRDSQYRNCRFDAAWDPQANSLSVTLIGTRTGQSKDLVVSGLPASVYSATNNPATDEAQEYEWVHAGQNGTHLELELEHDSRGNVISFNLEECVEQGFLGLKETCKSVAVGYEGDSDSAICE